MTIKRQLSEWTIEAISLVAGDNNYGSGNIKKLKAPQKPKIPKTPADYEAIRAAEMKRRRKAALNQRTLK